MKTWLESSLTRVFPSSTPESRPMLRLEGARGERLSFQAAFRTDDKHLEVFAEVAAPEGISTLVRRVGYVPVPHHTTDVPWEELDGRGKIPGLVPDPLFPETSIHAGPFETNAFWVTLTVSPDCAPGVHPISVKLSAPDTEFEPMQVELTVHQAVLPQREFPVTHWFYADAIIDWYRCDFFDEPFWSLLDTFFADLVTHGQDVIYVPVFTPPLDGVRRPAQLLHVTREGGQYIFDWSLVRRWVNTAKAAGLRRFEWVHLFSQWGVKDALRVYRGHGETAELLWPAETGATSDTYRDFLAQFLPAFKTFIDEEGLLDDSYFHLSDEPNGEEHLANYRAARELLRELAPWMKVMDALSHVEYARQGLTDIPVPKVNNVPDFIAADVPCWAYFCCHPRGRYLNRFMDTPLVKVRMTGALCYRTGMLGFLHWGYNSWYKSQTTQLIDPFTVSDGLAWPGWTYGDTFMVYPGPDGPIDSLRWEVFAESLQDYALLQGAGIDPDGPELSRIRDFAEFPRSPEWIARLRHLALEKLDANS